METGAKKRLYWSLQIVGWTLVVLLEFIPYTIEYGFQVTEFFVGFVNVLLSIILTHLYRLLLKRWNISSMPLSVLGFRMFFSVSLMGAFMTIVNLPVDMAILPRALVDHPVRLMYWSYYSVWCKNMLAWVLSYTIYHYVEQKRLTDLERIMLKTSMREAEAKVLRSQLNPHFMFNALNSIRALVLEDPIKAQQSVTQLSNLLRNALLADRRKTVELREELKTVEDYLELEKVRYEERLTFTIKAEPNVLFWQVPPMMLQTLVENGIKHGVSKMAGGGFLEIEAFQEQSELVILIRNTGHLTGTTSQSGGIGLQNTAERLSILYGKEANFKIFQESENRVCARVTMPMLSEGMLRFGGAGEVSK